MNRFPLPLREGAGGGGRRLRDGEAYRHIVAGGV